MATQDKKHLVMLDSGTTSHIMRSTDGMQNLHNCSVSISLGDDSVITASHKGTSEVTWNTSESKPRVRPGDVLVSDQLALNLLSIPALAKKGLSTLFIEDRALVMDTKDDMDLIGIAIKREDGLFYMDCNKELDGCVDRAMMAVICSRMESTTERNCGSHDKDEVDGSLSSRLPSSAIAQYTNTRCAVKRLSKKRVSQSDLWQKRLGHIGSKQAITKVINEGHLQHIFTESSRCDPCDKGKLRRSFRGSLTKASAPGNIHADVVVKIKTATDEGFTYFLCVTDEYSNYAETLRLTTKGEASDQLMRFMARFERQTDMKLKALHTDGGLEFNKAREKVKELGLVVSTTTPYKPASNGLVERTQDVLLSHARVCLRESSIPLRYWNDALRHASFAKNAVPYSQTGEAPHTLLHTKGPTYIQHMRPFGCRALIAPNPPHSPKFTSKLVDGKHLGHRKGGMYKTWTPKGITFSKHVKTNEASFPGLPHAEQEKDGTINSLSNGGFGHVEDSDDKSASTVSDRDVVTYIPPLETELSDHERLRYNLRSRAAFAMPR